jgi:hypothetical protein
MKLGKIATTQFHESFKKLMTQPKVPVRTVFKLKKISKVVTEETQSYQDTFNGFMKEYAVKDEEGAPKTFQVGGQTLINIIPEKLKEYNSKITELNDVDVDLEEIKCTDLGTESELSLTPADFIALEFIAE